MRFRVHCANPDTGDELNWEIECATIQEAEQRAQDAGMLVSRVEPIADAQIVEARHQPIEPAQAVRQSPLPTVNVKMEPTRSNSLGIASVILGILAFLICWIPFVSIVSMPVSGLGLLLGLIGLILALTRAGYGVGFAIAGSSVSALALVIASVMGFGMFVATTGVISDITEEMERTQAVATETGEIGVDTDPGDDETDEPVPTFKIISIDTKITESNSSWVKVAWILTVKNNTNEGQVFTATIEYLDGDGFIIDSDVGFGLTIGADAEEEFRGTSLVSASIAAQIETVEAKVQGF